jgi:hypothetical protein
MKCIIIEGKSTKKIETDVNEWLSANSNVQIKFVTQGGAGGSVLTTIFYD